MAISSFILVFYHKEENKIWVCILSIPASIGFLIKFEILWNGACEQFCYIDTESIF